MPLTVKQPPYVLILAIVIVGRISAYPCSLSHCLTSLAMQMKEQKKGQIMGAKVDQSGQLRAVVMMSQCTALGRIGWMSRPTYFVAHRASPISVAASFDICVTNRPEPECTYRLGQQELTQQNIIVMDSKAEWNE